MFAVTVASAKEVGTMVAAGIKLETAIEEIPENPPLFSEAGEGEQKQPELELQPEPAKEPEAPAPARTRRGNK